MSLVKALEKQSNLTETTNGAKAFKSTLNANLDFYGKSGNIGADPVILAEMFESAYMENSDLAVRNLLNMRDVRGGKGVRDNFRKMLPYLLEHGIGNSTLSTVLVKVVELGRYDDLFSVYNHSDNVSEVIENIFISHLNSDNPSLVAKWTPLNQKDETSKKFMKALRKKLGFNHKQMRKFIVSKRNVVETKMCENLWSEIEYKTVPSQAMRIYKKAFGKNDEVRFGEYIDRVNSGEEKINAGTLYPHEVLGSRSKVVDDVAIAQWNALPNFIKDGVSMLPMIDTSGSMTCSAYGSYDCLDIAVALGLYLSERNKSVFKDTFLTFNHKPEFINLSKVKGISERKRKTYNADWGGNTNIGAAFEMILSAAKTNNLTSDDLPDYLVVLSDMQFDTWSGNFPVSEEALLEFEKAGLKIPKMIWWNLSSSYENNPVTFDQKGNAFVCGFSPSVMKALLAVELEDFTPENIMLQDLMQDKYKTSF